MQDTNQIRDKVVLAGLNSPVLKKDENADEITMEELDKHFTGVVLTFRPTEEW